MADLLLILALVAWLTLWVLRETGHTQVRRGTGLRWARRRVSWDGNHHAGHAADALHPGGEHRTALNETAR